GELLHLEIAGAIDRCKLPGTVNNQWQLDAFSGSCDPPSLIVYSSDDGHPGVPTLWAIHPDGGGRRELGPAQGEYPRLSPDGTTVYFVDRNGHLSRAP